MQEKVAVVFLPGLGADGRLFGEIIDSLESQTCHCPALPVPEAKESLADYADRISSQGFLDQFDSERFLLVGISFGAQLAIELAARDSRVKSVLLLATHRSPREFTWQFQLQRFFILSSPLVFIKLGLKFFSRLFAWRERLSGHHRSLLLAMTNDLSLSEFKRFIYTAGAWDEPPEVMQPLIHLHGEKDWVIPQPSASKFEILIGGRHLINYSHEAEIADALKKLLEEASA